MMNEFLFISFAPLALIKLLFKYSDWDGIACQAKCIRWSELCNQSKYYFYVRLPYQHQTCIHIFLFKISPKDNNNIILLVSNNTMKFHLCLLFSPTKSIYYVFSNLMTINSTIDYFDYIGWMSNSCVALYLFFLEE